MCRVNHRLNIPTPLPPGTRPGTARPILLVLCLQKQFAESTALEILLPPPQEKALLEVEMKCCSGQECARGGWAGQSLVLDGTEMRMFPPPWNDCSWTVSALCLCRDRACLLQPSPRAKNVLWLPALYFRKVPTDGARPLPLWLQPQCPWLLMGHLAPWNNHGLAIASLLPCLPTAQDFPPSQVYLFCEFTWAYFASD